MGRTTENSFSRSGYSFDGWATQRNGGGVSYDDAASFPFTADVTLYAKWKLIPVTNFDVYIPVHTVTFDANGGSGYMDEIRSSSPLPLSTNAFTRNGYVFTGWGTEPESGVSFSDGDSYNFSSSLKLYAQWRLAPTKYPIPAFMSNSSKLSAGQAYATKLFANKLPASASVRCIGSTQGVRITSFDKTLARQRALAICNLVKQARPDVKISISTRPAAGLSVTNRKVVIDFR